MMKILGALLITQVLLTLLVIVKLVNIEGRLDDHEIVVERLAAKAPDFDHPQSDFEPMGTSRLSEVKLREIIREELAANTTTSVQRLVEGNQDFEPTRVDTPEYRYRVEKVSQQLDYFESVGEISNREMEALQAEIAKLQAKDRRHMLNRLVQSMNAGRIKSLF